jgi:hypothetical protein
MFTLLEPAPDRSIPGCMPGPACATVHGYNGFSFAAVPSPVTSGYLRKRFCFCPLSLGPNSKSCVCIAESTAYCTPHAAAATIKSRKGSATRPFPDRRRNTRVNASVTVLPRVVSPWARREEDGAEPPWRGRRAASSSSPRRPVFGSASWRTLSSQVDNCSPDSWLLRLCFCGGKHTSLGPWLARQLDLHVARFFL